MMPMHPGMMAMHPGMRPPPMARFIPPPPGRPPMGAVHYPSQDPTRMGSVPKPGETAPEDD